VINGNGHTIDANNQSRIFVVEGTNITIKNLTVINANSDAGGALYVYEGTSLTTDSLIFENNTAGGSVVYVYGSEYHSVNDIFENDAAMNGVVSVYESEYYSINDIFKDVTSTASGVINVAKSSVYVENALMASSKELSMGFIQCSDRSPG
jgi:hypothetical protein